MSSARPPSDCWWRLQLPSRMMLTRSAQMMVAPQLNGYWMINTPQFLAWIKPWRHFHELGQVRYCHSSYRALHVGEQHTSDHFPLHFCLALRVYAQWYRTTAAYQFAKADGPMFQRTVHNQLDAGLESKLRRIRHDNRQGACAAIIDGGAMHSFY